MESVYSRRILYFFKTGFYVLLFYILSSFFCFTDSSFVYYLRVSSTERSLGKRNRISLLRAFLFSFLFYLVAFFSWNSWEFNRALTPLDFEFNVISRSRLWMVCVVSSCISCFICSLPCFSSQYFQSWRARKIRSRSTGRRMNVKQSRIWYLHAYLDCC